MSDEVRECALKIGLAVMNISGSLPEGKRKEVEPWLKDIETYAEKLCKIAEGKQ